MNIWQNPERSISCPLRPASFLACDGDVYSLLVANGWVGFKRDNDVSMLSQQKLLTAMANVYFREIGDATSINRGFDESAARRIPSKHRINHIVFDLEDGITKRNRATTAEQARGHGALIHSEKLYTRPSGWPDFIRWRTGAATYSNRTRVEYVRRARADGTWSKPFRKIRIDVIRL